VTLPLQEDEDHFSRYERKNMKVEEFTAQKEGKKQSEAAINIKDDPASGFLAASHAYLT
jgi:hypothetical protein